MDWDNARDRLQGCYVTIPTMFNDVDLSVDFEAIRRHVNFLIDNGIETGTGVLLAGGAAGDFSTMTFEERVAVSREVVKAAAGRVPVAMGAQTTSTHELIELARAAEEIEADYIQISPPYYFTHSEEDLFEYVVAGADSADVGLIVYNTFWTSQEVSTDLIRRLSDIPNAVGLKWSMPDNGFMEFESIVSEFSEQFAIIDNQLKFVVSHILGARAIETHVCNYWPEWGLRVWEALEQGHYVEVQHQLVKVAMPFMKLWGEMERHTSGDGYLDKLCMELIGLGSSRCRPPTRDLRNEYRKVVRQMLLETGVPRVR